MDIGSPVNICNSFKGLQVSRRFEDDERFLNFGDGRSIPVLALLIVKLVLNSSIITLGDYHFYPSFFMNIIFVGLWAKQGFHLSIKENYYNVILNGIAVMTGQLKNGIYLLSQLVNVMYMSNKRSRIEDVSNAYLWHCRLGHLTRIG